MLIITNADADANANANANANADDVIEDDIIDEDDKELFVNDNIEFDKRAKGEQKEQPQEAEQKEHKYGKQNEQPPQKKDEISKEIKITPPIEYETETNLIKKNDDKKKIK